MTVIRPAGFPGFASVLLWLCFGSALALLWLRFGSALALLWLQRCASRWFKQRGDEVRGVGLGGRILRPRKTREKKAGGGWRIGPGLNWVAELTLRSQRTPHSLHSRAEKDLSVRWSPIGLLRVQRLPPLLPTSISKHLLLCPVYLPEYCCVYRRSPCSE